MVIESKLGVASRISNLILSCIFYLWIIQQYPDVHLPFDPFVYSTIGGHSGPTKAMDKAFGSAQQVIRYNRYNPFSHLYSHVFLGLSGYSTSAVSVLSHRHPAWYAPWHGWLNRLTALFFLLFYQICCYLYSWIFYSFPRCWRNPSTTGDSSASATSMTSRKAGVKSAAAPAVLGGSTFFSEKNAEVPRITMVYDGLWWFFECFRWE